MRSNHGRLCAMRIKYMDDYLLLYENFEPRDRLTAVALVDSMVFDFANPDDEVHWQSATTC
jgi:hypothetical protein